MTTDRDVAKPTVSMPDLMIETSWNSWPMAETSINYRRIAETTKRNNGQLEQSQCDHALPEWRSTSLPIGFKRREIYARHATLSAVHRDGAWSVCRDVKLHGLLAYASATDAYLYGEGCNTERSAASSKLDRWSFIFVWGVGELCWKSEGALFCFGTMTELCPAVKCASARLLPLSYHEIWFWRALFHRVSSLWQGLIMH